MGMTLCVFVRTVFLIDQFPTSNLLFSQITRLLAVMQYYSSQEIGATLFRMQDLTGRLLKSQCSAANGGKEAYDVTAVDS